MVTSYPLHTLVIITSKDEVDAFQWKKYLETNWERLIRKNAKILVLAGIHGEKDGQLGNLDHNLFEDYQRQIKYFMGKSRKKPPAKISQDILIRMYNLFWKMLVKVSIPLNWMKVN